MGLKRGSREHCVTTMLRQMQEKSFSEAVATLKRGRIKQTGPIPPPHALWRLGRWCLKNRRPKDASVPLQLYSDLYPHHQDRARVLHDLARALKGMRRIKRAGVVAREALRLDGQEPAVAG